MADPNWAHGRISTPGGQYPHTGPPMPGATNQYPVSSKPGMMPPYNQYNPAASQPGPMGGPPNSMAARPPGPNTGPIRPGQFGGPPGTFGAPHYQGPTPTNSATPPPTSSGGLLTSQGQAMNRSNSTPSMPPGQFGQPMMNGLPPRQIGPPGQFGAAPPSTRPPMANGQHQGQLAQPKPTLPPSAAGNPPQWSGQQHQNTQPPASVPQIRPPTQAPPPAVSGQSPYGQAPPPGPGAPPPQPGGRPNELPLPYHGHGQYSHQVPGLPNMVTPGLTPNNSEPPSQRSSRAPSPEPGTRYDALEGQFTPSGQGAQFPSPPASQPNYGQPGQTPPMPGQAPMPRQTPPVPGQVPTMPGQAPPMPGQAPPMPGQTPPMPGQTPTMPGQTPTMPGQFQPGQPLRPPMPGQSPPMMPPVPGQSPPGPMPPGQTPQPGATQGAVPPPGGQTGPGITGRRHYPQMPSSQPPSYNNQVPPPYPGGVTPAQPGGQVPNSVPGGVAPQPGAPVYPAANTYPGPNNTSQLNNSFNNMKLQPDTQRPINLLQEKMILPTEELEAPKPNLPLDYKKANCSPDIFRCTLDAIPNQQSLLSKSRLPLGILIHPFKDLAQLPVIQSSVIVRCRSCRTYINPFVTFIDMRRWKCNLCYRANELPEEFNYDPVSKTYGEPQRRPEIRSGTIEFIAPSEYMLRPPQPAVYLFLIDVSFNARETGYLQAFCQTLLEELDRIPGDARTQIGFLAYDRSLYFFNLAEGQSQPQMYVVSDTDEVFLPSPDNLLVNLQESKELITELLNILPDMFKSNIETATALGPALESAFKLMSPTGGRVSVFQTQLPTVGNGSLKSREDPNERSGKKVNHLGPATDFYKKLALDCSAQQIAVDLFLLNSQYADIASIGCISKFSGGSVHYFPGYHAVTNPPEAERFEGVLHRYLTRKIGFEAVMRIRCSRGLSLHTFHGNFFVRSTDLLSLPNVNPDSGFGMQMSIEDTIDANYVCFQAALLYTSSKGERRIRVHTLAVPVSQQLSEIHAAADQEAITALLAKMGSDKSRSASLGDARDAMINSAIDMLGSYGSTLTSAQRMGQLPCPYSLRLQPLFILSLLKSHAFRVGSSTKLDDRVYAMEQCKNLPTSYLMMLMYPRLYPVHNLDDKNNVISKGDAVVPQPPILQLSSANMDRHGAYLMDTGLRMYLWIGAAISDQFCRDVLDKPNFSNIQDPLFELPELENTTSDLLRSFIGYLNEQRPYPASLTILREDSRGRMQFLEHLVEDRTEATFSYYEFLQHLQKEVRS